MKSFLGLLLLVGPALAQPSAELNEANIACSQARLEYSVKSVKAPFAYPPEIASDCIIVEQKFRKALDDSDYAERQKKALRLRGLLDKVK